MTLNLSVRFLQQGTQVAYHLSMIHQMCVVQGIFSQHLQEDIQRALCLPERAENRFLEVPTRTGEVHGALWTDRDELTGDEPRQFTDLENVV